PRLVEVGVADGDQGGRVVVVVDGERLRRVARRAQRRGAVGEIGVTVVLADRVARVAGLDREGHAPHGLRGRQRHVDVVLLGAGGRAGEVVGDDAGEYRGV